MTQGKVEWFDKERGYGFISPLCGGGELFVEGGGLPADPRQVGTHGKGRL